MSEPSAEQNQNLESYRPTQEMLRLVAAIDELKGAWRALRSIAPERLTALRRVATIESVGSSTRIEGVRLTNRQIETLLSSLPDLDSHGLASRSFLSRDEEEVAGYAALMETIFESYAHLPPTENIVQQLHGILLRFSGKDERHRGHYKTLPNHVEAFGPNGESLGIVFETASAFETPFRMTALIAETCEALDSQSLHPLIAIGAFLVRFLAIHPFQDGNGRLSRALMTLLLLRAGYAYVPYSSLESVVEENKEAYYLALRRTQATLFAADTPTDWEPWLLFFLRALDKQRERLTARIEREQLIEGELPELSLRILEMARERGRVQSAEIAAVTGETRGTIRNRLNELIARHLLRKHSSGPATWYSLGDGRG